jgi:D-3-phosphoglycerate dehydrogenase / 2-oxoglutarate reductase
VVIDVETERSEEALARLKEIDGTIRARILH